MDDQEIRLKCLDRALEAVRTSSVKTQPHNVLYAARRFYEFVNNQEHPKADLAMPSDMERVAGIAGQ